MWPQLKRSSGGQSGARVGPAHTIALDGYAASHQAVRETRTDRLLPQDTKPRSSKYLNNLVEQDHRGIKSRTRPMLGFKNFASAATTIAGIEFLRCICKDQFAVTRLRSKSHAAPALWNAPLTAWISAILLVRFRLTQCGYLHQSRSDLMPILDQLGHAPRSSAHPWACPVPIPASVRVKAKVRD
jgi:hypothetical protein